MDSEFEKMASSEACWHLLNGDWKSGGVKQ